MKATGIVRRIDDLGRVVIPKEIRRTLRIREGDPLEIFTDREGEVILKKYSPIGELGTLAKIYAESLAQTLGCTVCITDTDQVVAVSGSGKKDLQDQFIGKEMGQLLSFHTGGGHGRGTHRQAQARQQQSGQHVSPLHRLSSSFLVRRKTHLTGVTYHTPGHLCIHFSFFVCPYSLWKEHAGPSPRICAIFLKFLL